ncbi:RING finger protein 224-like [Archocentrus centrarchus]|uniref:RING finger protein 224-like n=1 Tax=Archocentrus centrarchus TaxID=63155 RepID=UPI0011E9C11D|nr:RING finger protein 224-like [Archocentrus centrarchus]
MAEAVVGGGICGSGPPGSFPSDEYECKICYNYFDLDRHHPKLLSCSHTFCLECLETLHFREGRGWRIGCPVCRHRTPLTECRVRNLSDNTALTEALALKKHEPEDSSNAEEKTALPASPATSAETGGGRWETCKQVAFKTSCVCAIFSFLSMAVLLFLGLIFVHNLSHIRSLIPVCLSVASILALLSVILTWLTCMLYQPETEASNPVYLNIM